MTKHKNKQLLFNPSTREGLVTILSACELRLALLLRLRLLLPSSPASGLTAVLESACMMQCHDVKQCSCRRYAGMARAIMGFLSLQLHHPPCCRAPHTAAANAAACWRRSAM